MPLMYIIKGMERIKREGKRKLQGMNWISKVTRLAIYLRDNMQCLLCGKTVLDGIQLSLDHITPHIFKGSNKPNNLYTCCKVCNSKRQDKALALYVLENSGLTFDSAILVIKNIQRQRTMTVNRKKAKTILKKWAWKNALIYATLGDNDD